MSDRLPFRTFDDLAAQARPEPKWKVQGLWTPGSITGLAAFPKCGKTTFVFGLLHACQSARGFLGLATAPVSPLYLSEEGEDTFEEKRRAWPVRGGVLLWREMPTTPWPEIVAASIEHAKAEAHDALIVDTLPKWAGLRGDWENSAGAILEAVEPLEHAAAEGLAVLSCLHTRKAGGDYGEGVRGSNALVGALDVLLELGRVKGGGPNLREMKTVSRFRSTPETLRYRLVGDELQVIDSHTELREQIRGLIDADPAMSANAIHERVGGHRQTVLDLVKELREGV